jgi:hypothetical protein
VRALCFKRTERTAPVALRALSSVAYPSSRRLSALFFFRRAAAARLGSESLVTFSTSPASPGVGVFPAAGGGNIAGQQSLASPQQSLNSGSKHSASQQQLATSDPGGNTQKLPEGRGTRTGRVGRSSDARRMEWSVERKTRRRMEDDTLCG